MWTEVMNVFLFQDVNKVTHTHTLRETQQRSHSAAESHRDSFLLEGTPLFILLSSAMYQSK